MTIQQQVIEDHRALGRDELATAIELIVDQWGRAEGPARWDAAQRLTGLMTLWSIREGVRSYRARHRFVSLDACGELSIRSLRRSRPKKGS
ncbi:hypothetical protein AB1L88_15825 [Tautonia sp. JC769]|uniref:hypothetical protein n=1 Tax=Tautonia sp. JC769 TaxID=3232135 RepID=UPI0034576C0F